MSATDRTLAAVTLMYKSEGVNPDGSDWCWVQRTASGNVPAEGLVTGCITNEVVLTLPGHEGEKH